MYQILSILLQYRDYSRPQSGGEAIFRGLITGALLYGIGKIVSSVKESNKKRKKFDKAD